MRRSLGCAAVLALAAASAAQAESFNAKTGAWEMTVKITGAATALPADVMARMPPDRRAMLAKMDGQPTTRKACIQQDDLDQARFTRQRDACTSEIVTRTARKIVAKTSCARPAMKGTTTFEAKDREHVVGTVDNDVDGGGKIHVDITGKWLSASCDGVEPPVGGKGR